MSRRTQRDRPVTATRLARMSPGLGARLPGRRAGGPSDRVVSARRPGIAEHGRSGCGGYLRRRVLVSIVAVTACAVSVLTVPLAWAMARIFQGTAVLRLQRDAVWFAVVLSRSATHGSRPPRIPRPTHGVRVAVYRLSGRLLEGDGPPFSAVAGHAGDGMPHQGVEGSHLAVSAPVTRHGVVTAAVRVWMPFDWVTDRRTGAWVLLAGLGAAIVALSALLARHLARRIATPLERLTETAERLGDGDFGITPVRSGVREADAVGQALARTARRLGDLLERERRFSTSVSHQLRTPLTALVLGLEAAADTDDAGRRQAVATALRRVERLGETIEDLLLLSRETHHRRAPADAAALLARVADRHADAVAEAGRLLTVRCADGLPAVSASVPAVAQILDTLIDNALTHGAGEIRLTAADAGAGVAFEVGDDGPGPNGTGDVVFEARSPGARHGIGLPLARSLAEAEGGRLLLRRAGPRPVFTLLLPAADPARDGTDRAPRHGFPPAGSSSSR